MNLFEVNGFRNLPMITRLKFISAIVNIKPVVKKEYNNKKAQATFKRLKAKRKKKKR